MCATCDQAKKLPQAKAMMLLAGAMAEARKAGRSVECLDKTVGAIIGMAEAEYDPEADGEWEMNNR